MLASYLITEHPLFRIYFWQKLLHVSQFQTPFWKFVLMGIVIAVVTVFVCSLVDRVYVKIKNVMEKKVRQLRKQNE